MNSKRLVEVARNTMLSDLDERMVDFAKNIALAEKQNKYGR